MLKQPFCTYCGMEGHLAAACTWKTSLIQCDDGIHLIDLRKGFSDFYGWVLRRHPDGLLVSVRKATAAEIVTASLRAAAISLRERTADAAPADAPRASIDVATKRFEGPAMHWAPDQSERSLGMVEPKQAEGAQGEPAEHVPDEAFQVEFQEWWEEHGIYCRSGGGDYERTFAFQAWRHLYPQLLAARAAMAPPSPGQDHPERSLEMVQPSQAPELERPVVAARLYTDINGDIHVSVHATAGEPLMPIAQHGRIVGALRADRDDARRTAEYWKAEHLAGNVALESALARLAELEKQEPVGVMRASSEPGVAPYADIWPWLEPGMQLYATPVARDGQAPQAWLDVQAERRRQIEVEGWTPEHDNEHDHGQMARAAACYALAGSSAADDKTTALLVSLAWPWDQQWWKPTTARRDLVKACALTLAEIERLDRAAAPTAGGSDA